METKTLVVNGIPRQVLVDSDTLLVDVLRNQLQITSVKVGCGQGQCGACSVILDGKVTRACIVKMRRVPDQAQITTLEGVGTPAKLHPLQESWMFHGAAQCGFCTPGFIVSAKALLDSNPAPSREEVRDWFQKHHNICRCTGYKPLVDAVMDAAAVMRGDKDIEELRYKLPADGRAFGSRLPRPSALVKVTGLAEYGADAAVHMPPDTLHLALAQAKVSHAIIKGIDTSEAEKMPGVVRVLTHKDVKGKNRITGLITFADNKGDGWDRPILNDTKVFQYGDALAIVCADSEAHARAAADKVKFDLELLPEYMSAPEAMAPDAIEIHPGTPNIYYEPHIEKGEDTKPFFDDPENVVVEDSFYTQRQPHLNIEPDVGYGYLNEQGQLVIHSKSIGLHLHALMIAPGLGVKFPEELVMVQNTTGGTFGYKFSPTMEALIGVAVLATGRPCHLRYNYQQQQQYTGKRSPFWTKVRMAANKKTGKIVAMETDWTCDHGPYSEFNIGTDPEAADIVFKEKWKVVMVGLDLTYQARVSEEQVARIAAIPTASAKLLAEILTAFNVRYRRVRGFGDAPLHDPCAIACVLDPTVVRYVPVPISVELTGTRTRGMTVADFRRTAPEGCHTHAALELDLARFWDMMADAVSRLP